MNAETSRMALKVDLIDKPFTGWLKKVSCCTVSTAYFFWANLYIASSFWTV